MGDITLDSGLVLTERDRQRINAWLPFGAAPPGLPPPTPGPVPPPPITPPPPGGQVTIADLPWGATIYSGASFPAAGCWAGRFTVPLDAKARGDLSVAEYQGPAVNREVSVSLSPNDWRAIDPTGANGPLAKSSGNTAVIGFSAAGPRFGMPTLVPGRTYYFNVRNWSPLPAPPHCSCTGSSCPAVMASHSYD